MHIVGGKFYVRDTTDPFNPPGVDEVEGFDLFDDGAEELDLTAS